MKSPTPDLSISITSFNTSGLLRDCLKSIFKNSKGLNIEVFVTDNASKDDSVKMVQKQFKHVKLIRNSENKFFTISNNQALRRAKGRHVLILNSDTLIQPGTLQKAVKFLDTHPKIGALGVKHLYLNGQLEQTCQKLTTPLIEFLDTNILANLITRLRGKQFAVVDDVHYASWNRKSSRSVEAVCDACAFVPNHILKQIGYYDERFLLFFTENDLCLRIRELGYQCYHLADASITHIRAQSVSQFRPYRSYKFYEHDMLEYYRKYFGPVWWLFLYLTTRLNHLYYRLEPLLARIRKTT